MDLTKFDGRNIKVARLYKKMTLRDLSNKTDISINKLSKYELNTLLPTKEEVIILAYVLGVLRDYFFQPPIVDINKIINDNTTYFCKIHD